MSTPTKNISLTNLSVNIENPRFELVGNQREAIQVMIADQGDKLINLAKDIVETGMLNPGELILVTPHEKDKGHYNVLEGNRRVTALKVLSNPDLIDGKHSSFAKRLKPYAEQFKKKPILDIPCAVFNNPEDANKWIKLKHTGENEGVGIVRWDAQQVARFDERIEGTSPVALQAIDFLRKESSVPDTVKNKLKNVPSSSLDRLLKDKNVQQVIGINVKDNRLQTHLLKDEVVKGLTKIVTDLADKKIKVKDIYTKEDREKYIETFKPTDIPNKKKKAASAWELTSPTLPSKTSQSKSKPKHTPLSTDRETVIPKDCILSISEPRINKIYRELKGLNVDLFENAAGVMFRVFIELSLDTFIDHHKLTTVNKDATLRKKVDEVSLHMEKQGLADKHVCKGIRKAVNNNHDVLAMETFNAYIHNRHLSPIPKDLKITWDNIQIFVEKIWETIK